jgi:DNA mismatch endonuclease (patch repair protein)
MADVFSKEQRSQIMRQVKRNLNKSTELRLIRFFKLNFITGWRRNYKIYGKPDFVFPKKRLAVFVDGCFWHGHNCRNTKPKDNKNYWDNKIKKNIERDISVSNILESKGWKVLRIWECQLKEKILHTMTQRFVTS